MSGRSNPFKGLEELFEQMSRQFENAAQSWDVDVESTSDVDLTTGGSTTGVDLADHGDEFVLTVDVPGYEKEDLEVRLVNGDLQVSGERKKEVDEEEENYIRKERRTHSFDRRVRIPDPVDHDDVSATVNNGVLTVTLGKADPSDDSHSIDIE